MKIVVFEGLDASGKATQTKILAEALAQRGKRVKTASFPRYEKPIGQLIKKWLHREVTLTSEAVHMLYEADRQDFMHEINFLDYHLDYLVIDRYVLSNLAFGMAKGISLDWLQNMQQLIRQPDITFVLDVDSKSSFQRRPHNRDRHEVDLSLLNRTRAAYEFLGTREQQQEQLIYTINANGTAEEVHAAIIEFFDNQFI